MQDLQHVEGPLQTTPNPGVPQDDREEEDLSFLATNDRDRVRRTTDETPFSQTVKTETACCCSAARISLREQAYISVQCQSVRYHTRCRLRHFCCLPPKASRYPLCVPSVVRRNEDKLTLALLSVTHLFMCILRSYPGSAQCSERQSLSVPCGNKFARWAIARQTDRQRGGG